MVFSRRGQSNPIQHFVTSSSHAIDPSDHQNVFSTIMQLTHFITLSALACFAVANPVAVANRLAPRAGTQTYTVPIPYTEMDEDEVDTILQADFGISLADVRAGELPESLSSMSPNLDSRSNSIERREDCNQCLDR